MLPDFFLSASVAIAFLACDFSLRLYVSACSHWHLGV